MTSIGDPGEHIPYRGFVIIAPHKSLFGAYFEVNVSSETLALLVQLGSDDRVVKGTDRDDAIANAKARIDSILGRK